MSNRECIVYAKEDPCPYLKDKIACMPLRFQFRTLTPQEFDATLATGDRRVGQKLYRTACPTCNACEPLRINAQSFMPSRSQKKVLRKGEAIVVEEGELRFTTQKLKMYNQHKIQRGLSKNNRRMTMEGYLGWFHRSCTKTKEFRYIYEDKLVGLSILDFGAQDISSVYFFFDPAYAHLSLGTFSILYELNWMKERKKRYYYLGQYVAECTHLSYKNQFYPHERLIQNEWKTFQERS